MHNIDTLMSSKNDNWTTPKEIFDLLNDEFKFDIDVCASDDNHLCKRYYTKESNGLLQNWGGERCFCNPPYSEVAKWVEKAFYETKNKNTLVVMLIPSRTDTKYFHNFIYNRSEIRFVKGRLKFGNSNNNAPFPSMVVIFRGPYI